MTENGGTVEMVEISRLQVDPSYQRTLKPHHKRIAKKFDYRAAGTLTISMRPDSSLWILDGQQRVGAMKILNITQWAAKVFKVATIEEEAALFARINGGEGTCARVGERDKFKALVRSGDADALGAIKAVADGGLKLTVGYTSNRWPDVSSTAMIMTFYRIHGGVLLTRGISILSKAWPGDTDALKGTVIEGILCFMARYPHIDDGRAVRCFSEVPALQVLQEGKKAKKLSQASYSAVSDFLVSLYNKRLFAKNKLKTQKEQAKAEQEESA